MCVFVGTGVCPLVGDSSGVQMKWVKQRSGLKCEVEMK